MATKKTEPIPQLKSMKVSYSAGVKANIAKYEDASVFFSRAEDWDVTGLVVEATDELYTTRLAAITAELDELVERGYEEMKGQ